MIVIDCRKIELVVLGHITMDIDSESENNIYADNFSDDNANGLVNENDSDSEKIFRVVRRNYCEKKQKTQNKDNLFQLIH